VLRDSPKPRMPSDHRIRQIESADEKSDACRDITASLPQWFGLPEANKKYAEGIRDAVVFAAHESDGSLIGLIALKFPFSNNADLYWMGIKPQFHRRGIGKSLLGAAEDSARRHGCRTLSVETLSLSSGDPNYEKTYRFYESAGFIPLFELEPHNTKYRMCYLLAQIG
jgi:GNAT superfamily N-acetyltransferase